MKSNIKRVSEPLRHGLKTEKAQRKLVEALKKSNRQGTPSGWYKHANKIRLQKEKELSQIYKQINRLQDKADKLVEFIDATPCSKNMRCRRCKPNGDCDFCDTIDGVDMEVVNNYASTCDGCYDLTMHVDMEMEQETQFGYCPSCAKKRKA